MSPGCTGSGAFCLVKRDLCDLDGMRGVADRISKSIWIRYLIAGPGIDTSP
ncbi:hypothetical protein AURDEDRAFT_172317 [Auricularia subglabra TFB-10046 SS5]|nr:hypothetical protein AURDEDRAFT_172317 [Auricularia subglabra TFB-10046 SS5]